MVLAGLAAIALTASLMGQPAKQTVRVGPDDLADMQCVVMLMEGIGDDEAQNQSILSTMSYFMGKVAGRGHIERWDKVLVAYRSGLDQATRTQMTEDHGARCLIEGLAPTAAFAQATMAEVAAALATPSD